MLEPDQAYAAILGAHTRGPRCSFSLSLSVPLSGRTRDVRDVLPVELAFFPTFFHLLFPLFIRLFTHIVRTVNEGRGVPEYFLER